MRALPPVAPPARRLTGALAVAAATAVVGAAACGGGDTPTESRRLVVAPLAANDTLDYAGATRTLAARWATAPDRPADAVWLSRDTTVARVDQAGVVTAQDDGATYVVALAPGAAPDSARVAVRRRAARVTIALASSPSAVPGDPLADPPAVTVPLTRARRLVATLVDAGGVRLTAPWPGDADAAANVAWRSSRPDVAGVDANGVVAGVGSGTAVVTATPPAPAAPVSVTVTVSGPRPLRTDADTIDVGVGQLTTGVFTPGPALTADGLESGEGVTVILGSSDGRVFLFGTSDPRSFNSSETMRLSGASPRGALVIAGGSPGLARLTAVAAGFAPVAAWVRVGPPRLVLSGADWGATAGSVVRLRVTTVDHTGRMRRVAARVGLQVTSSDTSVLDAGGGNTFPDWSVPMGEPFGDVSVLARRAGQAWLRVSGHGYAAESVLVTVGRAGSGRLVFGDISHGAARVITIGAGQRGRPMDLFVSGTYPPPPGTVVTLRQRHPERLRVPAEVPLAPDLLAGRSIPHTGLAVGVDTVVAAAPGFAPETVVVHVTTPRLLVRDWPDTARVTRPATFRAFVVDSAGRVHLPAGDPLPLEVRTSDPARQQPEDPAVRVGVPAYADGDGGSDVARVRVLDPGPATVTLVDPAGRYAPLVLPALRVLPTGWEIGLARTAHLGATRRVSLGFGQRLGPNDVAFARPLGGSVYATPAELRSTDERVARVVPVAGPGEFGTGAVRFDVAAGDVAGATWVRVTAPGFAADSLRVDVARGQLGAEVEGPTFGARVGDSVDVVVRLRAPDGRERASETSVTVTLESTAPAVASVPAGLVLTLAPGQSAARARVRAAAAGTVVFRARDARTGAARYADGVTRPLGVEAP